MIGPTRKKQVHVLRFNAPERPGVYPYVCTFPGHWVIMSGNMIVARNDAEAKELLESTRPKVIKEWELADLVDLKTDDDELTLMRGLAAFKKAKCEQCHQVAGHGLNLGPDLSDVAKRFRGDRLLEQMLSPSLEIAEKYRSIRFLLDSGTVVSGVIQEENEKEVKVLTNLLNPNSVRTIAKAEIELRSQSRVSSMPEGLLDVLTKQEIADLLSLLQSQNDKHGH